MGLDILWGTFGRPLRVLERLRRLPQLQQGLRTIAQTDRSREIREADFPGQTGLLAKTLKLWR